MPAPLVKDRVYARPGRSTRFSDSAPVVHGRLISISSYEQVQSLRNLMNGEQAAGAVIINFPSMPDAIDLARRATYYVKSFFSMPDGFHQYQYTDPLRIPFSFKLHAFDHEYCPQGGLTILDIAAKLHALQLPLGRTGAAVATRQTGPDPAPSQSQGAAGTIGSWFGFGPRTSEQQLTAAQTASSSDTVHISADDGSVSYPVAVLLDLIYAGSDAPGISCVGYIEDVNARLLGPWLTPPGSGYKNIPTSLEASFTFVHRPSHGNKPAISKVTMGGAAVDAVEAANVNAYADDVKDRLYNTIHLVTGDAGYRGFGFNKSTPG